MVPFLACSFLITVLKMSQPKSETSAGNFTKKNYEDTKKIELTLLTFAH